MPCKTPMIGLVLSTMMVASASGVAPHEKALVGQQIADMEFKDIRYLTRRISEFKECKAIVVICMNTTCPLVKRYLPKVNRMENAFRKRQVQFIGLNVGADDSIRDMAAQAVEYEIDFPVVKDVDANCVKALGVERTPEVVVLDQERVLRYRGRIDDQYRIGGARPTSNSNDLEAAIEAVLEGQNPSPAETSVDGCLITMPTVHISEKAVEYADVASIFQKHCVECHRSGTQAPFKLTQYEDVAANAAMIAEVVQDQRMPPWYASPQDKHFVNARGLSPTERMTILQWIRAGVKRGDAIDQPEPPAAGEWLIGEPSLVIQTQETHRIPADGYVPYKYSILPFEAPHNLWIKSIEIKSNNPPVLHHCNLLGIPSGKPLNHAYFITGKVPGSEPLVADEGVAILLPKGTKLALQIHYTTVGKEESSRISVAMKYASGVVNKQLKHVLVKNTKFEIPPGAPNHQVVHSEVLADDTTGIGLFTHMHLRGKDMTFIAHLPNGDSRRLLTVPNYNFDWQMGYRWRPGDRRFPAGTRIECIAHFDNSEFNPYNPDASAAVREGRQTYHEMMYGFYFFTTDKENLKLRVDPATGIASPQSNDDA